MSEISLEKSRKIKSRGIALTHKDQGYSANQRPVSLLMKSDISPDKLTVEVIKTLRQVSVEISMEEFLRRFFDMWSSDAQLLAKMFGYETELENEAAENPTDEWLQDYNERVQERLEEKLECITLLKSAKEGKELSLPEQYALLKAQQTFENGVAEFGITFEEVAGTATADINKTVVISTDSGEATVTSGEIKTDHTEETIVDKVETDVTKSQVYIDLMKQNEELKANAAAAKEIIKASEDLRKATLVEKTKGMSFIDEDQREGVAVMLMKSENALVLTLLEKAQTSITELTQKVEDVKKEFGAKEHGHEDPADIKDLKGPQAILDAKIEAAKAAHLKNKTA